MEENKDLRWSRSGSKWEQISSVDIQPKLENKIYKIGYNPMGGTYLSEFGESFEFPFKIYGLEKSFIDHVMYTFDNTDRNLGILLNGKKGTGKTVCAKILANSMKLPIIIVGENTPDLVDFLSKISQPCVLFFDEFEKTFEKNNKELLTLMDGVYNTIGRKIFILTTNNIYLDDNFLSRPSRIRYCKTFGNLPYETVEEYIEENLHDKSHKEELIDYINSLELSTIDILKSLVDELNLHKCSVSNFKGFFNVKTADYQYRILYKYKRNDSYTLEDFKKEISLIGTPKRNAEEGDEENYDLDFDSLQGTTVINYTIYDFGIESTSTNTVYAISSMRQGEEFFCGKIVQPIDLDGCMVIEDNRRGNEVYIYVKNFQYMPKIYSSYK